MHLFEHNWWKKKRFLFKNLILFITTKWCTNKEQKQPKTKARALIFFKRGKPQGGCFPLAQGPVLWWPLPACWGLLLAAMFDPRSLRSQQKRELKKKKMWTLFGWVGRLLEAEQSGQRRTGPQFSAAAWKSKRHGTTHGTTRGTALRTSTCVTAAIYRVVCCESDIRSQET